MALWPKQLAKKLKRKKLKNVGIQNSTKPQGERNCLVQRCKEGLQDACLAFFWHFPLKENYQCTKFYLSGRVNSMMLIGSIVGFPAVKTTLHGGQTSRNAGGVKQNLIAVEICVCLIGTGRYNIVAYNRIYIYIYACVEWLLFLWAIPTRRNRSWERELKKINENSLFGTSSEKNAHMTNKRPALVFFPCGSPKKIGSAHRSWKGVVKRSAPWNFTQMLRCRRDRRERCRGDPIKLTNSKSQKSFCWNKAF